MNLPWGEQHATGLDGDKSKGPLFAFAGPQAGVNGAMGVRLAFILAVGLLVPGPLAAQPAVTEPVSKGSAPTGPLNGDSEPPLATQETSSEEAAPSEESPTDAPSPETTETEQGKQGEGEQAPHDPNEDWDDEDEIPREPFRPHFETERTPPPDPAKAQEGAFRQGRLRLGLGFGGARSDQEGWLVLGVNAGYFLADGLEAHADTGFWLIGDPFLFTVSPGLRYVFHMVPEVKPYIGGFYRRYVAGGSTAGADGVGGRAGVLFMTGLRSHFGGGVIYERIIQDHLFTQRNQVYPEILLSLVF